MYLTKEEQDCLIDYSRKPENLRLALAIGAIQENLKIAIIAGFQEKLREYVKDGLQRKDLPWCVTSDLNQQLSEEKLRGEFLMLSITREGSKRKIGLYKWKEWETYLGGWCDGEPALTQEQLEPALVGVGSGGEYNHNGFEWWRCERDLGSDEAEALKNMNGQKEFVEHYGKVLLKAVKRIENLLCIEEGSR